MIPKQKFRLLIKFWRNYRPKFVGHTIIASSFIILVLGYTNCGQFSTTAKLNESRNSSSLNGTPIGSLDGIKLYNVNCAGCHSTVALTTKKGRSTDQILAAIVQVPQMNMLKLTPNEIAAIAKALAPQASTAITPETIAAKYFPAASTNRVPKRIFRLTREQIDITTKTLLPSYGVTSLTAVMAADPLQINYEYADIINFNSSNFTPLSNWISQIVAKVALSPQGVINCTAQGNSDSCLRTQARTFILKAFRGDVTDQKITQFTNFFINNITPMGIADATASLVDVVLSSPQYLYREEYQVETSGRLIAPEALQMITYTLADAPAEKVSLSSTMASSLIATRDAQKSTVATVMASPESRAKLVKFFLAWLEVREPSEMTISRADFPEFTPQVADAMAVETRAFLSYHLSKTTPKLKDLTQATQSFVSQPLAQIYGINANGLTGKTLVDLNTSERLGLFSQGAVIASHSGPTTTRLIKRGTFFARKVMCMELGATPPGIDTTIPEGFDKTERQKVEMLTNQTRCLGCHSVINPLGFFQENYNAIGKWRTLDNGLPIDAGVHFTDLDEGPVNTDGPVPTLKTFTNSMMFKQCFVRQLFRFYMGRNETPSDDPVLKAMFLAFVANDEQDILKTLQTMANSDRFLER